MGALSQYIVVALLVVTLATFALDINELPDAEWEQSGQEIVT